MERLIPAISAASQLERLDQASASPPIFPENFIGRPMAQQLIFGTASVQRRG
ncbi:hypothetical protein [Aurantimonas sp. 22II-16-19i]|uniref:hypothetical protein n=1 Tax=Aurantimonas sp. 22II-16-19i TaxID=1317114 RepID=UPI0009F7B4C6|nr:hypothetical protein [Aurantimonas sp. 22II-16-19i]ORE85794.1 rhizopine catabolism protein [Aurantimonas sp. 22II-16-19i]